MTPGDEPRIGRHSKAYRFRTTTVRMIDALAERLNLSATSTVELSIRRLFDAEGLTLQEEEA